MITTTTGTDTTHRAPRRSAVAAATVASLSVLVLVAASGCAPRAAARPRVVHLRPPPPAYTFYVPARDAAESARLAEIGPRSRTRWRRWFSRAATAYPPPSVVLVAFKREKRMDVYAGFAPYHLTYLRSIPITAASGGPGPKLREGDRQVPEGVYRVEALNPNSDYHVSLRLDYPNVHDRLMGLRDGRRHLGGDIMIHGSDRSIGCLAVGDEAAEDLFVIAADTGIENVSVWILPRDFRRTGERAVAPGQPPWVHDLYADLDRRLRSLPVPATGAPGGTAHPPGTVRASSRAVTRAD